MHHARAPSSGSRLSMTGNDPDAAWFDQRNIAALLAGMQEGAVLMDAGSSIVAANKAAKELLGLGIEQMSGRSSLDPLWQSLHADGSPWPGTDHPSVRSLRTGEPQMNQIMGVQSSGTLRWLRVNAIPIDGQDDSDDTAQAVLCTFADITAERERARGRHDALSITRGGEANDELVARLDRDGTIMRVSDSSARVLGMSPETIIGTSGRDWLHPDDAQAVADNPDLLRRPVATYRVRHADGSYRHLETSTFFHPGEQGIIDVLDMVGRDVTDREVAQQALRQAEHRFRLTFDMGPTAKAIVLPDGRFMRVNAVMAHLVQADAHEMLGRSWADFVLEDDRDEFQAFLDDTMATDQGSKSCLVRLRRRDGQMLHASVWASAVHQEDGRPVYLIAHTEDVTAHKQTQDALAYQANHDALTALPNRKLLLDRLADALERAADSPNSVAVLFCDVDRFKRINESLGHDARDLLLIEIARRMRRAIRRADTVGRLSGDEFLVICEQLHSRDDALARAERIRAITDEPIIVGGHMLQVSLSIGVSFAARGDQPGVVLRQADTAMYAAKAGGRGRFEVYDEKLRNRARQRLQIETDLRIAIAAGQLRLHHQPIVHLLERAVIGREALVRWQHPERGLLAPDAFLDVAEESDLIVEVGDWVLTEACRQAVYLRRHVGDFRMGVNVSAIEVARPDFRARVERALANSGWPAEFLVLELTETALLQASPMTLIGVRALAAQGVRLAIDDFGTGYSSLTYLQKLPVRIVKIDRSFVAEITSDAKSRAMTQAVIDLGTALDLDVVAEGVETAEQARVLVDLGCPMAQGYYFGRPAPAEAAISSASDAV